MSIVLVGLAIPGGELLKLVTGPFQLIGLGWLGWGLARHGGAPPARHAAWRPRLAAAILTAAYLRTSPLAAVRAIMLVLVVLLLTVPELRAVRSALRAAPAA